MLVRTRREPNNPAVLSPKQFEIEFGISVATQSKLRTRKSKKNDGDYAIPFFKVGNKVCYQREAIMDWFSKLQERETNQTNVVEWRQEKAYETWMGRFYL